MPSTQPSIDSPHPPPHTQTGTAPQADLAVPGVSLCAFGAVVSPSVIVMAYFLALRATMRAWTAAEETEGQSAANGAAGPH